MVLGPLDEWLIAASPSNIDLCDALLSSGSPQLPTIRSTSPSVPRLEIDPFDTAPFSESFSGLFELDYSLDLLEIFEEPLVTGGVEDVICAESAADISYNIEHFTNIKELVPEWEDDEIEEIMVMSRKTRLPTIPEAPEAGCVLEGITLSDLDMVHELDDGTVTNTKVSLCRDRNTNIIHVVKSVTVSQGDYRLEESISRMVNELNCPFLAKTHWHFWNAEHLNLIMDFYPGGDLLTHISEYGTFRPEPALFYASEIVLGISALHTAGILHCALKPENIMIDALGHIVLTDFSRAKWFRSSDDIDTGGHQDFPGWAHELAVDCWSFGVILYFMLFGTHPFGGPTLSEDDWLLHYKIAHNSVPFYPPAEGIDPVARDLIMKCLEWDPLVPNIEQIKAHGYFSSVDWRCVAIRDVTVPYVPERIKDDVDLQKLHWHRTSADKVIEPAFLVSVPEDLPFQTVDAYKDCPVIRETSIVANSIQTSPKSGHDEPARITVSTHDIPTPVEPIGVIMTLDDQVSQMSAKERQALFWETIDCDINSSASPRLHTPHKLRKQRSNIPPRRVLSTIILSAIRRPANIRTKQLRKATSVPTLVPQHPHFLHVHGIEKIGNGIGFTYCQPLAARSKASICTTTPRSCHGIFSGKFPALGLRPIRKKAKSRLNHGSGGPPIAETEEEREQTAVMREVYGSAWNFGMSPVFVSSPTERTAVNSPASDAGLWTPSSVVFKDGNTNTKEIKAGDPDATLRLVSSFSPSSGLESVGFHRF